MDPIKRWFKHSSPISKLLMAISVTTAIYVGNKLWYAPYSKRLRHKQAEEWANYIIEQEESMKENTENQ